MLMVPTNWSNKVKINVYTASCVPVSGLLASIISSFYLGDKWLSHHPLSYL